MKAADAPTAAAIYLGTPGNTLAKWLESQGKPSAAGGSGSQTPDGAAEFDPAEIDSLMQGP